MMQYLKAGLSTTWCFIMLTAWGQSPMPIPAWADGDKLHPIVSRTIEGTASKAYWYAPLQYEVPIYEKTEWSLELPERFMMAISDYFKNNGLGNNGINPFDPDQIDVWAEIWTPGSKEVLRVNGFFYQHMARITNGNVNSWNWQDLATPQPFRFRFAPRTTGWHYVKLFASIKNTEKFESSPFAFEAVDNDPKEGFMRITPNHRYYQKEDDKIFFPIGQNLLTAHFCACEKISEKDKDGWLNKDCNTCYNNASDDPCCGLNIEWRQSFWRSPHQNVRNKVEHPASFIKMLEELESLKLSGANTFRTLLTPISYDFEFEKLNNYQDRQFMAWELDQLLDKADDLDLMVELCMLIHTQFTHSFSASWDWSDLDKWSEGYQGYCYYTERDKTKCDLEPASFFSSEQAKIYYKKKLRYFFARYGYSSSLLQLELLSEANNIGFRQGDSSNPEDWWGWLNNQLPASRAYNNHAQTRYDMGQWSEQMARYIKEDLQQSHLIACSYTGTAMMSDQFAQGAPNCEDSLFDIAQMSPHLDVIAHSSYDLGLDRWKKWSDHESPFSSEWYRFQCPQPAQKNKQKFRGYADVNRPVVHSENGNDLTYNRDDQWFEKDLWCNAFAGYASSGMAWGKMYQNERWKMFGQVDRFMQEIIFPIADLANDTTWSVDWSEGRTKNPTARRMELVYMKNNVPGQYVAFGILMNRTWNPATSPPKSLNEAETKSFISDWEPIFKDGIDQVSFIPFVDIPYRYSLAPTIAGMGQCNSYIITYYDPYTLQIVQRSDDDVILGAGVRLKNYPELTKSRPYVLFTVVRNGDCITR